MLAQQLVNALVLGSVYALFSLGFTLMFGVLNVINLLYGFYFAIGAFVALWGVKGLGLSLWLAAPLGALAAGLLAMVVDTLLLTPLRRARAPELSTLIVTLGGVLLANSLINALLGAEVRRFPASLFNHDPWSLGPVLVTPLQLVIVATVLALVAGLLLFLRASRAGAGIRALSENSDAAALMGVNVGRSVALVSFASGMMAGTAGILIGLQFNSVHPYMGEAMMLRGFAVIIIGGLGDIGGALIAGLALGLLEVMTAAYLSSQFKEAVAFAALVLTLWLRPSGLFGKTLGKRA